MKKTSHIVLSWIVAMLLGCGGGWGGNGSTPESINHAPDINGVPTTLSITEGTSRTVNNIVCTDSDWDNVTMTVKSSNSDLNVSYNNSNLTLDASTINVADWVNLSTNVALTCSDWDKNTTKNIDVTIQDEVNDRLLTYTTNIPSQVSYNGELNGTITLNDPDGSLGGSYSFDLLDENNNSVYSWDIVDANDDWNYTFSVNLSSLNLPEGNYTFKTEAISPVVGWENPQGDVVVSQGIEIINNAPTVTGISYVDNNWNSITQWDIISLSATINDEIVNTVTWKVTKDWNILDSGTGQFPGYDYHIWQTEWWQLKIHLEVTDEKWLGVLATLIDEPII